MAKKNSLYSFYMEKNVYFCSMNFPRCHRLSILRKPFGRALLWMLVLVAAMPAAAQNCQGFMNPTSFNYAPGSTGRWSARVGDRIVGATGGSTGNNILSTCSYPTAQNIIGHQNITSPQLYSGACTYTDNTCHHTFYDAHDHRFSIYTLSANSGLDEFTVNGNNGLPRIPPGFTSSIRLGDMRSTGTAVYPNSGTYPVGNNRGSEALFYTMQVRPQTAFIFINYAVVARRFDHSPQQAGEFLIRVVGKDPATHQWNNYPLNDSLWYCVPAPAFSSTLPAPWVEGRPGPAAGGTTCSYCYKPWTKVAINLSRYLYDSVRIEMYTSDCIYNVDPIYAYIAGSCQSMTIKQQGCASGESDVVDTLEAPEGLLSYTWYVSTTAYPGGPATSTALANLNFRQLGTTSTNNIHPARIADFIISEGESMGDTAAIKLFKCVVTSALDPSKPFQTDLYASVANARPNVSYNAVSECNGTFNLHAYGWVPHQSSGGTIHVVDSLTIWTIHDGGPNTPVLDTLHGIDATYTFSDTRTHTVRLTMFSSDSGCYTTKTFTVAAPPPPVADLSISSHTLCEGDTCILSDNSRNITSHQWVFADTIITSHGVDDTRVLHRIFSEPVNPVMLIVSDAYGCADTAYDTIYFFASSTIRFSPDTIVCSGQWSHVEAIIPIAGCTYNWYRHYNRPGEQPIESGSILHVLQEEPSTVYYVKIISPYGCEAWDSVTLHRAELTLTADPPHASICPGDTVTLTAGGASSYRWKASPADPDLDSQATQRIIHVSPKRTTTYTLTGLAADSCAPTPVRIKVNYVPLPRLALDYSPSIINSEESVVRFTDLSEGRAESYWVFSDSTHAWGESVSHRYIIEGDSLVGARLTSYNHLHCPADTSVTVTVKNFAFWCPNVFTPLREGNNVFSIINTYPMAVFHIYIYNRMGALVYTSDDPNFQWDGTSSGVACPQGTYNYRISYIPQNDTRENIVFGTVTLLR